jgi:hypothetical protein
VIQRDENGAWHSDALSTAKPDISGFGDWVMRMSQEFSSDGTASGNQSIVCDSDDLRSDGVPPPLATHCITHRSDDDSSTEDGHASDLPDLETDSMEDIAAPNFLHLTAHSSDASPDDQYANLPGLMQCRF